MKPSFFSSGSSALWLEDFKSRTDSRKFCDTFGGTAADLIPANNLGIVATWPPIYIGKESDKHWEEGEDLSLLEFKAIEYRRGGNAVAERNNWRESQRFLNGNSCAGESISTR
jgi:hypothetical protein